MPGTDHVRIEKFARITGRLSIAFALCCAVPAQASDLVFEFGNPSFGGNPFNSSHLQAIANAQNDYGDPDAVDRSDPAAQFLRTLQSRLLSSLATQITDVVFGENAQDSGTIRFGEQEINFVRGVDGVTLNIFNGADGTTTEITVPLLSGV